MILLAAPYIRRAFMRDFGDRVTREVMNDLAFNGSEKVGTEDRTPDSAG